MLLAIKTWFTGLSWVGKSLVGVGALSVIGVAGSGGANSPVTPTPFEPTPAITQELEQEEELPAPVVETKEVEETEAIPFDTTTVNDGTLVEGSSRVKTHGVNGARTLKYSVTYTDGLQTDKQLVSNTVTQAPVTQVTAVGTKKKQAANCDPNYTPCVPNVSYDLDCGDISFSVRVIGSDPHGFDRDNDGHGCESN